MKNHPDEWPPLLSDHFSWKLSFHSSLQMTPWPGITLTELAAYIQQVDEINVHIKIKAFVLKCPIDVKLNWKQHVWITSGRSGCSEHC